MTVLWVMKNHIGYELSIHKHIGWRQYFNIIFRHRFLSSNLTESHLLCSRNPTAAKFGKRLGSSAAGIRAKFHGDWNTRNTSLEASRLCEVWWYIEGILPKGPYPPCLCMADRALLAGYPRYYRAYPITLIICMPMLTVFLAWSGMASGRPLTQ